MTQYQAVTQALEQLGGVATLAQLYKEVPKIPGCAWQTKTPQASIRRIVQLSKDLFKIKPGLYGLASKRKEIEARGIIPETKANQGSLEARPDPGKKRKSCTGDLGSSLQVEQTKMSADVHVIFGRKGKLWWSSPAFDFLVRRFICADGNTVMREVRECC